MANIKLNLPAVPFSGQIVTFTAPCNCDQVKDGLVINGDTYTVCDSMGECVTGKGGVWIAGAQISVVLDCENKKAFIQNGKPAPNAIGALATDGSNHMTDILRSKCDETTGEGRFYGNQWGTYIDSNYGDDRNRRGIFIANPTAMADLSGAMVAYDRVNDNEIAYPLLHTGNFGVWSQVIGAAKIQTNTYNGNGAVGANSPNILTFDFVPKMVIVLRSTSSGIRVDDDGFIWLGQTIENSTRVFSLSGTTLSWYSTQNDANAQLNTPNVKYYWIAIG